MSLESGFSERCSSRGKENDREQRGGAEDFIFRFSRGYLNSKIKTKLKTILFLLNSSIGLLHCTSYIIFKCIALYKDINTQT